MVRPNFWTRLHFGRPILLESNLFMVRTRLRPRLKLYLISMLISAMAMSPTLRTGFPLSAPGDVAMVVAILYVGYTLTYFSFTP